MRIKSLTAPLKITSIITSLIYSAYFVSPAYAADRVNVNVNYSLNIAGFKLGSVGLAARLKENSYAISIRAFTTGGLDSLMRFTVETRARGEYNGHHVNSTEYMTAYSNQRVKRHVVVKYPNASRATVDANPAYLAFKDSVPLRAEHLHNVVDPLGAMLLPFNKKYAINADQQCNRVQQIFDGVTRYKLQMQAVENTDTNLTNAIACQVGYTPIAGHRKSQADKTIIDNYAMAKVWLMPIEKAGVLLPVKVEIPTQFGTFSIISSSIDVGGNKIAVK
ncbi:MAG: DUF3108 domain-containing protein [Alphaproteobacteria bacterium]|nr:DUF3108 domain-containing protein [Alphaproteobacteria bacterium]